MGSWCSVREESVLCCSFSFHCEYYLNGDSWGVSIPWNVLCAVVGHRVSKVPPSSRHLRFSENLAALYRICAATSFLTCGHFELIGRPCQWTACFGVIAQSWSNVPEYYDNIPPGLLLPFIPRPMWTRLWP